jgi:hypothetical protein
MLPADTCVRVRGVAQPGSVLAWGARGRVFESHRPDQYTKTILIWFLHNTYLHKLFIVLCLSAK